MDTEPQRQALDLGLSAFGGAAFWGLYHLTTLMRAGRSVEPQHWLRAGLTVVAGVVAGVIAAMILGPALVPMVPVIGLRDSHVVGFIIGAGAWELAPFAFRALRAFGAKKAKEAGE